jgi:hypothetical protein
MKYIDRVHKLHRVDCTIGVTIVVIDDFQNSRSTKPRSGFAAFGFSPYSATPMSFRTGSGIWRSRFLVSPRKIAGRLEGGISPIMPVVV